MPPSPTRSRAAHRLWASRTPEQRAQVSAAISRALRGRKQDPEVVATRTAKVRTTWAERSPSERQAQTSSAQRAAQSPSAKRKRAESLTRWRAANPGVPGSSGLSLRETIALFLVAHPGATDTEVARAIGRSTYLVRRHRPEVTRRKPKRKHLRAALARLSSAEIRRLLLGNTPPCPRCEEVYRVRFYRDNRHGSIFRGRCPACGHSFTPPRTARIERAPFPKLAPSALLAWADLVASGLSLHTAADRAGLSRSIANTLADYLLARLTRAD